MNRRDKRGAKASGINDIEEKIIIIVVYKSFSGFINVLNGDKNISITLIETKLNDNNIFLYFINRNKTNENIIKALIKEYININNRDINKTNGKINYEKNSNCNLYFSFFNNQSLRVLSNSLIFLI